VLKLYQISSLLFSKVSILIALLFIFVVQFVFLGLGLINLFRLRLVLLLVDRLCRYLFSCLIILLQCICRPVESRALGLVCFFALAERPLKRTLLDNRLWSFRLDGGEMALEARAEKEVVNEGAQPLEQAH